MTPGRAQTRKHRLSFRLALFILTSTALLFALAFGYNFHYSKRLVLKNVRENAANLTQSLVRRLETTLQSVERVPRYLALRLTDQKPDAGQLRSMIKDMVETNPNIYGSTIAFEPYAMDPQELYFAPYFFQNDAQAISYTNLGGDQYQYFHWDWYSIPRYLNRAVWSEPYFDEGGGNILMATFSVPFHRMTRQGREFQGVVTADISLENLLENISGLQLYDSGYAFLLSRTGQFVTHPDTNRIMRQSIFSIAEEMDLIELRRIGKDMIAGRQGFADIKNLHTDQESLLYFAPVPSSGWSVGVVIPKNELYADIISLNHAVLLIGGAGFSLLFLVVVAIAQSITKPLRSLLGATKEIAKGNLDVALPSVRIHDEVGELSSSVNSMRLALKEYINNLTETTKAKERIESELKIARNIQMNFLPKHFPPFPDRSEFDIFAVLDSAKQVGGDLYDFFLLNESHLFFSVGDVSDKGVPAALFMAVTKTLMKGIAEQELEPSDILDKVNVELCQGNESSMFVTLFCGILDLRNGRLRYSNAGHNPPLILSSGQAPQWLELPPGLVLGGMEEARFMTREIHLRPGDKLLAYTDGVTEAMDANQNLYSETRLLQQVQAGATRQAEGLVKAVMDSVRSFSKGVPQSDDITLLCLAYNGPSNDEN